MKYAHLGIGLLAIMLCSGATSLARTAKSAPEGQSAAQQFEQISQWVGRWGVDETDRLTIVFERTANGRTIVERWETPNGLHSMTVYHMDGDMLVATHYCPQGNQPRLVSRGSDGDDITFTFRDATDLDPQESYQHDLGFEPQPDGSLVRSEIYLAPGGQAEPGQYTLRRAGS
jgi:hypothetical protein